MGQLAAATWLGHFTPPPLQLTHHWRSSLTAPLLAFLPCHWSLLLLPCPLIPGNLPRDTCRQPICSMGQLAAYPGSQSACQEVGLYLPIGCSPSSLASWNTQIPSQAFGVGYRWEEEGRDFLCLAGKLLRGLARHRGGVDVGGRDRNSKGWKSFRGDN